MSVLELVEPEGRRRLGRWRWLALPAVADLVRRQRSRRRLGHIHSALTQGRYDDVVRDAHGFFGTLWDAPARIATSVALLCAGNASATLDVLASGNVSHGTACFLRAHAHALLGDKSQARVLLEEAIGDTPGLCPLAERNPLLGPLMVEPPLGGYS